MDAQDLPMTDPTRRRVLRATPALLGALAGCDALTGDDEPTTTPTTSEAPTDRPPKQALVVVNASPADQFVSLAVRRSGTVVSSTTVEMPAETRRTFSLRAPTGILDLQLETTDGRTAGHAWVVGDAIAELTIRLTANDVEFTQTAWCTPTCAPLSRGGTAGARPFQDVPVFVRSAAGATAAVENDTDETQAVQVTVRGATGPLLEYAYVVPPSVRLEIPLVLPGPAYEVTVATATATHTTGWSPANERHLEFRLTPDGVQSTCGELTAALVLQNFDDTVHRLEVTASRPDSDRVVFAQFYLLQPGANYREEAVFTGSGEYELRVRTSEGAVVTEEWWLCPPRGPTQISVGSGGALSVVQHHPGT